MEKETGMERGGASQARSSFIISGVGARPNSPRLIRVRYYTYGSNCTDNDLLRTSNFKYADIAVRQAMWHMTQQKYGFVGVAEVYDVETGELHAIITQSLDKGIRISFHRDPKRPVVVGDTF